MGIMGSDFVAVSCIVAGGVIGGLGWSALEVDEADAPAAPDCAGVIVTTLSTPDVVVRIGDDERIVVASPTPPAANMRIACGDTDATVEELRLRTDEARVRIFRTRRDLRSPQRHRLRVRVAPEPPVAPAAPEPPIAVTAPEPPRAPDVPESPEVPVAPETPSTPDSPDPLR